MKKIFLLLIILNSITIVNAQNLSEIGLFKYTKNNERDAILFSVFSIIQSRGNWEAKSDSEVVYTLKFTKIDEENGVLHFVITEIYNRPELKKFKPTHYIDFCKNFIVIREKGKSDFLINNLKFPEINSIIFNKIEKKMLGDGVSATYNSNFYLIKISPTLFSIELVIHSGDLPKEYFSE